MKMNQEIRRAWVERLRSGKDRQGRGTLKATRLGQETPELCCLGVLCEMAVEAGVKVEVLTEEGIIATSYDGNTSFPPPSVMEWAGVVANPNGHAYTYRVNTGKDVSRGANARVVWERKSLTEENDQNMRSFAQIADLIENDKDA